MPPIRKSAPLYSKDLLPSSEIIATALTIGGSTVSTGSLQALVAGSLNDYTITQSTIDTTPIGFNNPAAANFTNLTTGTPLNGGYDVTFWGYPSSYAKWVAANGLWKISSNGNQSGGLQVDSIMLQKNTLSTTLGPLVLNPTGNVVLPTNRNLQFGDQDGLSSTIQSNDQGGLQIKAAKCINLLPDIAVTIPQGKPLWLDGTCSSATTPFYRTGIWNEPTSSRLVLGGNGGIALSANVGTPIELPTPNTPLVFGTNANLKSPRLQGDSDNGILNISSLKAIDLSSPQVTLPPNGHLAWYPTPNSNYITGGNGLTNGQGITLAGGTDDVILTGNKNIVLGPAQTVVIPNTQTLSFPAASTSLGVRDNNADPSFLLKSTLPGSSFILQAGSGITRLPNGQSLYFGSEGSDIQSIQSGGQSTLNITAPDIHLNGNVTVTGGSTLLETTQLVADDPIVEVGSQLPPGDQQDRGLVSFYLERNDPLLKASFMGWQPKIDAFTFLGYTHDDGTGHYVSGKWGNLQSGDLTVQSSITARDPNTGLQLQASSIHIPSTTPLLIGDTGAGFLSDPSSAYGSILQVLGNKLQFGSSSLSGDVHVGDPLVLTNATGGLAVSAANIILGSPSATTPTLRVQNGNNGSVPGMLDWQNITAFNLPNDVPLQWTSGLQLSSNPPSIRGNELTNTIRLNAAKDFFVDAPTLSGPVTWNGNPIGFEYGGTGRDAFTIAAAIPFVNNSTSALSESISLRFDLNSKRILLDDLCISSRTILLPDESSSFTIPNGTFVIGQANTGDILSNAGQIRLAVYGQGQIRDKLFLGSSSERFICAAQTTQQSSDVLIGGTSLILGGNTLGASQDGVPLFIRSPIDLPADKAITWRGTGSSTIISHLSTEYLELNADNGIYLPSSIQRITQWGGHYTTGETELVGFYRERNTLHFSGSRFSLSRPHAILALGTNELSTTPNGALQLDSSTNIRLNAPQIVIDGDLRVLGTVLETISNTTILDQNIFSIGQGRLLSIQSLIAYSGGSDDEILITTSTPHELLSQQTIQIVDTNCTPDLEGSHVTNQIISSTQFTILCSSALTSNGSTGVIRAPLYSHVGVDVGFQLGYYNTRTAAPTNAFLIWQDQTQGFALFESGQLTNGVVQNGVLASLSIEDLTTTTISGFTLRGSLNANSQIVSGSKFYITGGEISTTQIDDWTTTTVGVIQNLNSDFVRGLTITDFVLRDGSQALYADWDAGQYSVSSLFLEAKNCRNTLYQSNVLNTTTPPPLLYSPTVTDPQTGRFVVDTSYYGYDFTTHTLVASIDVSQPNNNITFRDQQIPGNKVGPGLAQCDISGNAQTVTDGIYRHDYVLPHSILVSTPDANNPTALALPTGTVLGTDNNGNTTALSGTAINEIIGPYLLWERRYATSTWENAPALDLTKHLSKLTPSPLTSGTANGIYYAILPNGTAEGQVHRLKPFALVQGQTSIAVKLRYVAPDDTSTKGDVWIHFTNNGQSIELIWDDDESAWYNSSAGVDVFQYIDMM